MKVNETSSGALEYNRNLDDKIRNISKTKEQEIERIKKIYDKKVEGAKAEGEDRYEASLKRNDEIIAGAGIQYEEKLKSYKENLDRTEKNVSQSELALKTDHAEKMKSLKEQFANNVEDEFYRANDTQRSVQDQMETSVQKIQNRSRSEQKHLETEARSYISALGSDYNQKITSEERDYRSRLLADNRTHEEALKNQKSELKAMLDKNMQQGKRLEAEKVQIQKEELTFLDKHQKDMIAQRNADFKVRYEKMVQEHEAILNNLKGHLEADMRNMVESISTQKRMIANKTEDPFYRVETLNPMMAETEKDITVSLKVPEYEKENVHLSVHGRDIKLTLTRKYTDSLESPDGSTNKSTRNELFSKEFMTKDILNPKQISQKYENGVLLFKIQKA